MTQDLNASSCESSTRITTKTLADVAFDEGRRLENDINICAVGYGVKLRGGLPDERTASLVYFVRQKLASAQQIEACGSWPVPPRVSDYPTDVVEIGQMARASADRSMPVGRRGNLVAAPLIGGTATMGLGTQVPGPGGYGTIGGQCFDTVTNAPLILSNAHVWGQILGVEVTQPVMAATLFGASVSSAVGGESPAMVLTRIPAGLTAPVVFANAVSQTHLITGNDDDPLLFGQGATPVAASTRTEGEQVTINAPTGGFAPAGRNVALAPNWTYWRSSNSAVQSASSFVPHAASKHLIARRVFTNAASYTGSQTINLYAEVVPAAAGPASDHFVVALLYPYPNGGKFIPRVLRPTSRQTPTTVVTQFTGFPAPARLGTASLPFVVAGGFAVDAGALGTFQNANAGTLPAGTFALKLPEGTVRVFVPPSTLPVGAIPPSAPGDAAGLVGLTWDVPLLEGTNNIPPDGAILFHIWRADLGRLNSTGPTQEVDNSSHQRITDTPFAPGQMLLGDPPPPTLAGWPSARLFGVDGPLIDGWYAYKISGIDLFERFSALSSHAHWLNTDGSPAENDFAVRLVDNTPPPPPTRVQAWVLDPNDPNLLQDDSYNAWPAEFRSSLGLRVRWVWTGLHMRHAPDLQEFRIYFNPGTAQPSGLDSWADRIAVVAPNQHIVGEDELVTVVRADGTKVEDTGATVSGTTVTLAGSVHLDGVPIDGYELELADASSRKLFKLLELDVVHRTAKVDVAPSLSGTSGWRIVLRERTYELFLPNTGLPYTLPLVPTLQAPLQYGLVGVTAADHELDAPDKFGQGSLAGRYGNESAIGGPATVYCVNRSIPDPPSLVTFPGEHRFATRADFNSLSYFALHYVRVADLYVHVFRAMDEALFLTDSLKGFSGTPRDTELGKLTAPPEWRAGQAQAAIDEINTKLHQMSDYASLSDNALRLLASLPSNSEAFTRLTRAPLGTIDPNTGLRNDEDVFGKNDSSDPSSINYYNFVAGASDRGSFEDILDGRARNRYFYRVAAIDAAQNMSDLGMSTPPVYLPEFRPPQAPLLINASGGDRSITLNVVATDAAIDTYHVYRANSAPAAQDILMMNLISTYTDSRPSGSRTDPFTITDATVAAYQDYFYRVTAMTKVTTTEPESRESLATPPLGARAFDGSPPPEPSWERAEWVKLDSSGGEHAMSESDPNLVPVIAIRLAYASATIARVLPQTMTSNKARGASGWLKPTLDGAGDQVIAAYLRGLDTSVAQTLRARAINRGGIEAVSTTQEVSAP